MKILYIAGDGRSGSTLLDSILSNIDGSISVGECHRFWNRFYEAESICSCGVSIVSCELWNSVDSKLNENFQDYDPLDFKKRVLEIQKIKNFNKIPSIVSLKRWESFCNQVIFYYQIISTISERKIIIDSSKSISWVYFLEQLNFTDIYIIHLERNLAEVANSWLKVKYLPEYPNSKVPMPVKSITLSTKTWLKVKFMSLRLKKSKHYLFLSYESFCKDTESWLDIIQKFINENFNNKNLLMQPTHAIGGNPMRAGTEKKIKIKMLQSPKENLTRVQYLLLSLINFIAKILIK